MKKLLREQKGLTLVEILVAMLLLSLVILTALTLLVNGMGVSDVSNERTQSLNLAEELMEYWKHNITVPDGWEGEELTLSPTTNYNRNNKNYKARIDAVRYDPDSPTGLGEGNIFAQITVKVWTKNENNPDVELKTVVRVNVGT